MRARSAGRGISVTSRALSGLPFAVTVHTANGRVGLIHAQGPVPRRSVLQILDDQPLAPETAPLDWDTLCEALAQADGITRTERLSTAAEESLWRRPETGSSERGENLPLESTAWRSCCTDTMRHRNRGGRRRRWSASTPACTSRSTDTSRSRRSKPASRSSTASPGSTRCSSRRHSDPRRTSMVHSTAHKHNSTRRATDQGVLDALAPPVSGARSRLIAAAEAARARGELDAAILYGSRARGDHDTESDWDVCLVGGASAETARKAIAEDTNLRDREHLDCHRPATARGNRGNRVGPHRSGRPDPRRRSTPARQHHHRADDNRDGGLATGLDDQTSAPRGQGDHRAGKRKGICPHLAPHRGHR